MSAGNRRRRKFNPLHPDAGRMMTVKIVLHGLAGKRSSGELVPECFSPGRQRHGLPGRCV
jgi:hypothetical protein